MSLHIIHRLREDTQPGSRKAWGEYLRKRDLSPSIYNQRVYAHQHPNDKADYTIDIKEGKEVLLEVFSK